MGVFLKYISKNMFEKKGRFFLLLFSIAVSTALLLASAGVVEVVTNSFDEQSKAGGTADVRIVSNTEDPFVDEQDLMSDKLKDLTPELNVTGIINNEEKIRYISLHGRHGYEGTMTEGDPGFVSEKTDGTPRCIISKRIAERDHLKNGDELSFYLGGEEIRFRIGAVSANENVFYSDRPEAFNIVVPYEYLNKKLGAEGKASWILANVSEGTVDDFVKEFNDAHTDLQALSMKNEVFTDSSITMGLYAMMAIVAIVSSIIIYGVFKLILAERMSVIGTFMSQGATKKKVERIIRMEGLLYGLIGGAVGCIIGEVLLFFINRWTSPLAEYGIYTPYHVNAVYILVGMVFAAVLSVASAYFPVRAIRKYEAKDVILSRVEQRTGKVLAKRIIGFTLIAFATVVFFLSGDAKAGISPYGFLAAYAGIVLITPSIVKGISWLLGRAFQNNHTLYLAMNNIHSSRLLRNNIVLIVISLSSVMMIASFGKSMTDLVTDAYSKADYDYCISGIISSDPTQPTTNKILDRLESMDSVREGTVSPLYYAQAKADDDMTAILLGVRSGFGKTYDRYFEVSEKYRKEFDALEASTGREVLLPIKVQKQLKKNVGDTVNITINSATVPFKIVGIYDGKVFNAGLCILVKDDVIKQEFHVKEADTIYFATNGNDQAVRDDLAPYLKSLGVTWTTRAEDMKRNDEQNQQIVMIMEIFAYLAMIIASIGVMSNITICFLQRKREMAVMASVGMNKTGRMGLILTESLASVAFSILLSIPFTILLTDLMTGFAAFVGLPMTITFSWTVLPFYAMVITGIILTASFSTMLKSRKLSVVQELKYE